ncbi:hypothetical protein GCM10010371_68890 [Streptomyces subrutilus]|uniref:Resolvase/invertase-type recombinase catalytic domain-containing protein n=2 Tax=Streptomyces subrutilus TaxID=36818 RepID=A0A918RHW0_9ACTN|nr:hypothetical protein GCM10010371_68890 [Streptomyces subrutilus]
MTLAAELQAGGIQLELLTSPLTGIYDPGGMGAMFFAVLAVAGHIERNYIREKALEGQVAAVEEGNHGGHHFDASGLQPAGLTLPGCRGPGPCQSLRPR